MNIVYCDVGSMCIKCGDSYIRYNNGYGDGEFMVYIFKNCEEFDRFIDEHNFKEEFITSAIFNNAKLMSYDCCYNISYDSDLNKELAELNGWFGICRILDEDGDPTGHMALVGRDD